ncbi:DMT family transporter [bacterium]|nr:DMT family transporter [bacterium]
MTPNIAAHDEEPGAYRRGVFFVVLAACLWSTGGVVVKAVELSPMATSAARSIFAALVFLVAARGRVLPPRAGRRWFLLGAFSYAYVVTTFVISTRWTTAANAIILQDTAPLWVMLFSPVLLGERTRPRDIVAILIGGIGVAFCMRQGLSLPRGDSLFTKQTLGDLMAISSGIAFAAQMIVLRKMNRSTPGRTASPGDAYRMLFTGNLIAAVVGLPALSGDLHLISGAIPFMLLVWLGIGQLGFGYFCFQRGVRHVPAVQASILSLTEPILNPIWVALAVGEIPSLSTIGGGGLVLAAVIVGVWPRK